MISGSPLTVHQHNARQCLRQLQGAFTVNARTLNQPGTQSRSLSSSTCGEAVSMKSHKHPVRRDGLLITGKPGHALVA